MIKVKFVLINYCARNKNPVNVNSCNKKKAQRTFKSARRIVQICTALISVRAKRYKIANSYMKNDHMSGQIRYKNWGKWHKNALYRAKSTRKTFAKNKK